MDLSGRELAMFGFGSTLLFFGIGSLVLNLIGFEFVLMMWIDNWGIETGWWIRGAIIAGGIVVCLVGAAMDQSGGEAEAEGDLESH